MKKRGFCIFLLLFVTCFRLMAQAPSPSDSGFYLIDSLDLSMVDDKEKTLLDTSLQHYHKATTDTDRVSWLVYIAEQSWNDNIWPHYNDLAHQKTKLMIEKEDLSEKELRFYQNVLAQTLNNRGYYYNNLGDIARALDCYEQSLQIREEINDLAGIATSLNNLGILYQNQGNHKKALEAYERSLGIFRKIEQPGIATVLNNIGYAYDVQGDTSKALHYYNEALRINEENDDPEGVATCLNNIGSVLSLRGELEEALAIHQRALALRKEIDDKPGMSYSLNNIGSVYHKMGDIEKAEEYTLQSLEIAQSIGYPENIRNASRKLYEIYKESGRKAEALKYYETYITMRDSITNEQTQRKTVEQEAQHEYEKQKAIAAKEFEKQIAVELEKEARQRVVIIAAVIVLVLTIIFLVIVFRRFREARHQRNVIREQNQKLNVVNKEISEHRDEIVASIEYAKLIQNALLPLEEYERTALPEHFIFYRPKDIVSGDFYWFFEKGDLLYIAVVDCTGHGVPGGFLTMLGTSFLNEINSVAEMLSPAEILNRLRDKIVTDLSQQDGKNKDGMDISLLRLDRNTLEAAWAGANNPLYILRGTNKSQTPNDKVQHEPDEVVEIIKADRQPIAYTEFAKPFTNNTLSLQKGDLLYLFTDGFADQFGGERGKKMSYKRFRKELASMQGLSMGEQKAKLSAFFEEWKGNEPQLDDVCVIGLRV